MKNTITKEIQKVTKNYKESEKIESYKKVIKMNSELIERGLTKDRGYSLLTISDKPIKYSSNFK